MRRLLIFCFVLLLVSCGKKKSSETKDATNTSDAAANQFLDQYKNTSDTTSLVGNYKIASIKKSSVSHDCNSEMKDTSNRGVYKNPSYIQVIPYTAKDASLMGKLSESVPTRPLEANNAFTLGDFIFAKPTSKAYSTVGHTIIFTNNTCSFLVSLTVFKKTDKSLTVEERVFSVTMPLSRNDCTSSTTSNDNTKFKDAWDKALTGSEKCDSRMVLTAESI